MEKTIKGNIGFWGALKEFFVAAKPSNQSDLLKELGVKKGIWSGLKYLTFLLLILPLRILTFLLNPTKKMVIVCRQLAEIVMRLALFGDGENNPMNRLSAQYSRYVLHFVQGIDTDMTPDVEGMEETMWSYRVRNALTFLVYALFLLLAFDAASYLSDVIALNGLISGITLGIAGIGFSSGVAGVVSGGAIAIAGYILAIAFVLYFAYLLMVIFRAGVEMIRAIFAYEEKEYVDFLHEILSYTRAKTKEIYGEDVADKAMEAIMENYVLKNVENLEYAGEKAIVWEPENGK